MAKPKIMPATFEMPKFHDYVVVELRYESPVGVDKRRFVGREQGEDQARNLNEVIDKFDVQDVQFQFHVPKGAIHMSLELAAGLPAAPKAAMIGKRLQKAHGDRFEIPRFFQTNFVRLVPKRADDAHEIAKAMKSRAAVWSAHVAPRPVPPVFFQPPDMAEPGPFNIEPTQGYLYSAPVGIGAMDVWSEGGGKGQGVRICDIEGGWNLSHEDLPDGIAVIGGTPLTIDEWVNHGTAVLGEMVSVSNGFGAVGISHKAKAVVQGAFDGTVFNAAAAIDNAASRLSPGDVILIELHSELHPKTGDYVAMQYFPEIFTAIRTAVDRGIVVVEAAGNGNQDFDSATYNDSGLQKDCGAIVVGAGVSPSNRIDFNGFGTGMPAYTFLGNPRSRIFFSNYGKIVNLQGWGWHVSTLGYGDAQGGPDPNRHYTFRFSGTSSASPIVTGAVACLQGVAKARRGGPLTPAKVREILVKTGTPQEDSPGVPAASNHIGPQPDLVAAIGKL